VNGLAGSVLLLLFVSTVFIGMVRGAVGIKLDPFILVRPFGRALKKLPGRTLRGLARGFEGIRVRSWRRAGRPTSSLPAKLMLYPCGAACWIVSGILSVLADIVGETTK